MMHRLQVHPSRLLTPVRSRLPACTRVARRLQPRAALTQKPNLPPQAAPAQDPWKKIVDKQSSGEAVSGKIQAVNKGGVIVSLEDGLQGFIPMSMLGPQRVKPSEKGALEHLIGQMITTKVVSVDLQSRRSEIVLSERRVLETEALRGLSAGQVVNGTVVKIIEYGAFVRLEGNSGISGLVPRAEVSWSPVVTIESVLSIGQPVTAKVMEVDPERCRLSLSIKQTLVDPLRQTMDQLEWSEGEFQEAEIQNLARQLRRQTGIESVTLTRMARAKQSAAQGLDVYLVRNEDCKVNFQGESIDGDEPELPCQYTIVARLGAQYQEIKVGSKLSRKDMKKAMQQAVSAVAPTM